MIVSINGVKAKWWGIALGGAGFFWVGQLALLTLAPKAGASLRLNLILELGAALAGSAGCLYVAMRNSERIRLGWSLIGAAAALFGICKALWDLGELSGMRQTPLMRMLEGGFLAAVPLSMAGVLAFPISKDSGRTFVRHIMDGSIMGSSLLVVAWAAGIGSVAQYAAGLQWEVNLGTAYLLGNVLIIAVVVYRFSQLSRSGQDSLLLLLGGLVLMALADNSFDYQNVFSTYARGSYLDSIWVAGGVLIGLGALRTLRSTKRRTSDSEVYSKRVALLPYPCAVGALVVALHMQLVSGGMDKFTSIGLAVVILLVFLRQYLVINENQALFAAMKLREKELNHMAHHDSLTGLPNRVQFRRSVDAALADYSSEHRSGVLFIDLDDFKAVNDLQGHSIGDMVLAAAAGRISRCIRPSDIAARLGGDEFAVLVDKATDLKQIEGIASRILRELARPIVVQGVTVNLTGTIGLTEAMLDDDSYDKLVNRSDTAMLAAKRLGKNQVILAPNRSSSALAPATS